MYLTISLFQYIHFFPVHLTAYINLQVLQTLSIH